MRVFLSAQDLRDTLPDQPRWRRIAQAIDGAAGRPERVAFSIGDSVTGVILPTTAEPTFVAHRRFREARIVLDGEALLEVAARHDLAVVEPYCDLSDRELLATGDGARAGAVGAGAGVGATVLRLAPGEIVLLEADEAVRCTGGRGRYLRLLVTVVGDDA